MSTAIVSQGDFNAALGSRFDNGSPFIYRSVLVLLLYWKDSDYDFKSEAIRLRALFTERFNYDVCDFEIPSDNAAAALNVRISSLVFQDSKPHSLIIIHYGGHGHDDDDRREEEAYPSRKGIWAARREITDTDVLSWSDIQPQLRHGKGDFLVLLDCCFGAQAARAASDHIIPPNVELLAAAPMGCSVPLPGPNSFTHAFIEEVESALAEQGYADVCDLHHKLASGSRALMQTPTHFSHGTQATIRLQPHFPHLGSNSTASQTTLMLEMVIAGTLDHLLLDKVIRWLSRYAPHEISGLKAIELVGRAKAIENFFAAEDIEVQSANSLTSMKFESLPNESQAEMKSAWSTFNWSLLASFRSLLPWGNAIDCDQFNMSTEQQSIEVSDEAKIQTFVEEFDANISLLSTTIERNVLAMPAFLEQKNIEIAALDPAAKNLGLLESFCKRAENIQFKTALEENTRLKREFLLEECKPNTRPKGGSLVEDHHPRFGRVLIEYSYLPARNDGISELAWTQIQQKNESRMDHIVKLLSVEDPGFNTLRSLGWTSNSSESRSGMLFQHPRDDSYDVVSLYTILGSPERGKVVFPRPTLGQRFVIAHTVGCTILKWHGVDWLHESVSSLNIFFSRHIETNVVDFSKPLLCGFSFSRHAGHYSTPCQGRDDIIRNIYQHPDRQGLSPHLTHSKEHDLYSFGVLLFELGFWSRASVLFSKYVTDDRTKAIRGAMLRRVDALGPEMGTSFAAATRTCLELNFHVNEDDKACSRLARAFEHKVLRKLCLGIRLDS